MKILITGYLGFVGKYFVKKYLKHDITGIDIKENIDCRDFFKINNIKYDLVIHLAAIVGGRETIENSPLSVAVDLAIDSEMIQWALRTRPERIVYFSSSAAYPIELQKDELKYKLLESDINLLDMRSPDLTYGWAKLSGEYCLEFLKAEGIKVHVFRPFSGYGTDQDLNYPFPTFVNRAKEKCTPFNIWGNGEQVRDFIHIRDIVDAVDAAIINDICVPVNLGTGIPTSFNQLKELVCQKMGYDPEINHIKSKPSGVMYRCSNNHLMLSFYKPKIDLVRGIDMAFSNII